jgi:tRNA dimethylallyltransferase
VPSVPVIPVVAIAGPTAAGKSRMALALCERLEAFGGAEIVSVDSAQVYRGMDIGTAKPDRATQARVPHHLIDVVDPAQNYSAARFASDAAARIAAIRGRGRLPLLVGGTLL